MAYYPAWVAGTFPPERIDFSRFDWIDFAFAIPNENLDLDWDDADTDPAILARLVTVAHQQGKKVKLSIGGWDGSRLFSPILGSDDGRQVFVKNIATVYKEYRLDGIDIDWEYPGRLGHPRNYVDQNDTSNLLEFLKLLRKNLPSSARISAAVTPTPFADASERPMGDVRAFADVLDWFLLMNYDTWGASSNPGPNAPLNDACRNSTQPEASAFAAIGAWIKAGVPANQLVLGVPSYGYISRSNATGLRQRDEEAPPFYARPLSDTGEETGQVQFRELVNQGALCVDPNKPRAYRGCGGFTREWDACSDTPFLLSKVGGQVITYDDGQSLGLKAAYAKQLGLLGVNVFDLHGDTDQWDLTDSLRQGLGL
ncbi:glycoside hydrolase family 18 protein [Russula earlei]|uniref:Glycoside hydrolase family 18 protein n=1 Tax=Russula earlei TaxID=71964 RepID=A0ACC0UKE8_9AGAM|nr:glycoside hydrolase family 18 protein [Russula earlei]